MLVSSTFWDDFKLGQGDDKKKFLAVKFKKPHDMRGVTNLYFKSIVSKLTMTPFQYFPWTD